MHIGLKLITPLLGERCRARMGEAMVRDALNVDQRAGVSIDGKPSYTIEEAAAQLTRYGTSWARF